MNTDKELMSIETTLKELHAYAKLLFLRSGRQFEDKALYQELEDNSSPEDSINDSSSSKNVTLGNIDTDHLRRKFLDRLSETVSSAKGGRHVVASYMFYWPDKVKVFVAINSGFTEGDALSRFLDSLCISLRAIASASDTEAETHMDVLWAFLLCHQSSRLEASIVDLRQIMKNFPRLLPQHPSSKLSSKSSSSSDIVGVILDFEDCLKLLAEMIFSDGDSSSEQHGSLVTLSHDLYRTFPAEKFQALGRQGEKLHQAIGFLGRLKISFHVLVEAAKQIPGFECLSFIPVINPKTRKKPPGQEWSLAKTFGALNLQVNDAVIETLMAPSSSRIRWTKTKLINDFSRLKSPTWEVHAEIQLIVFTLSHPNDIANGKRFDYIGCSRYTCLLCSKFLNSFQGLKTRGCHGKLYNHSWTLPPGDSIGNDAQQTLHEAAKDVTTWMRKKLIGSKRPPNQMKAEVKESTIGGSLISTLGTNQDHHLVHAVSQHLYSQRAQNLYRQSNSESLLNSVEDDEAPRIEVRDPTHLEHSPYCSVCWDVETTRRCSHCGDGLFCSENCEREMPLSHLLKCNMRQVTSADFLFDDALQDTIPQDPQVLEDYWFDRCHNGHEQSHLLGLFKGLLLCLPDNVTRETLHQWRSDPGGNKYLAAKIVESFEKIPKSSVGGYFPWFLRHRERFELPAGHESIPRIPNPMTQVRNMKDKARKFLAPEDQNKSFADLGPFSKMHCFEFYSMILANQYPPPMNRDDCHWFNFGFVICRNQHEEKSLSAMYNNMLFGSKSQFEYAESVGYSILMETAKRGQRNPSCTFDEFWQAWDKGKFMTVFDKCWPKSTNQQSYYHGEYSVCDRLRKFFEAKTPRPSIWKLCHFIALQNVSVESVVPEISHAAREYGFSEHLDARTTLELRDFYTQLFEKAEPTEIHSERMKGNLLQFSERLVNCVTLRVKEILTNLRRPTTKSLFSWLSLA